MKNHCLTKKLICGIFASALIPLSAEIRNGSFNHFGTPPDAKTVEQIRAKNVKCPDAGQWPQWWSTNGANGEIAFPTGGRSGRYAKLTGKGLYLIGYHGLPMKGDFVLEFYARGKGALCANFYSYAKTGNGVRGISGPNTAKPVAVDLDNGNWERYRFRITCPENVFNVHPVFCALKGTVDLDDTRIFRNNDTMMYLADTEAALRREKGLPVMTDSIPVDADMKKKTEWFSALVKRFRSFQPPEERKKCCADILKTADELLPYLTTEGLSSIKGQNCSDMIILGRAMQTLMGERPETPAAPVVKEAAADRPKEPVRKAADGTVSIRSVVPGKILYREGDTGRVKIDFVNAGNVPVSGKLTVRLGYDIDSVRTIAENNIALPPGVSSKTIVFPVGEEMFGREAEVSFISGDGSVKAYGKEYFQVAKEFLRVMMHGNSRYMNLVHYFASEPTDFGVQIPTINKYFSGQPRYNLNYASRKGLIRHRRDIKHYKQTFYQCRSFCGGMGFEEIRKHPDYILYGANGQPEVDPVYGGDPNPFELAAPVERDPAARAKLLKGQKFLDLDISGWHHVCADFSNPEVVRYGTKCIVDFMNWIGLDGIYLDDVPCVQPGYNWQGIRNTAGKTKEQIADMNAEISKLWHSELRRLKPDIGSWCNGVNPNGCRWYRSLGMWERTMGMGVDIDKGKDVNDKLVKDLTSWKNTIFLFEVSHCFSVNHEGFMRYPDQWMKSLIESRDYMIQHLGGGVVFGYILVPKPPANDESNGYWPTLSYFHALTLATQHHHILYGPDETGLPSQQPFDQFATRYSALLWGRDIKTVPADKADVRIGTGKENIFYRDFIYSRDTEKGTDRIVHIARKYPLAKWDLSWSVQPPPLKNLSFSMPVPEGMKPVRVKCMRPYLSGEPTRIVEDFPEFKTENGRVSFELPPVYYYHMVTVSFEKEK